MAVKTVCDSCSKPILPEFVERRGVAVIREYCPDCVKPIDEMLLEIDKLHDALASKWSKDLLKIHKKYKKCGGLPDVSLEEH